jgi:hypothetical protein
MNPASPVLTLSIYPSEIFLGESAFLDAMVNDGSEDCNASEGCSGPCTASAGWGGTPAPLSQIVTPTIVGHIIYTISCPANDGSIASVSVTLTVRRLRSRSPTFGAGLTLLGQAGVYGRRE